MKNIRFLSCLMVIFMVSGCTVVFQKGRTSDLEKIQSLSKQVDELANAKIILEERLQKEIADKEVRLEMAEKGLVVTFVSDVLFDSGKAKLRPESYEALNKVAQVLKENVPDLNVGVEGYTDNQPILHSGWKSNWELSSARALSVVHYLIDAQGVRPDRLRAIGYGEFHPVASNDTKEGRQLNRRVEIVILPRINKITKEKDTVSDEDVIKQDPHLK
ncbi:MAG: OmpA family protein [Candidatus Omnitrophota bacterium]